MGLAKDPLQSWLACVWMKRHIACCLSDALVRVLNICWPASRFREARFKVGDIEPCMRRDGPLDDADCIFLDWSEWLKKYVEGEPRNLPPSASNASHLRYERLGEPVATRVEVAKHWLP